MLTRMAIPHCRFRKGGLLRRGPSFSLLQRKGLEGGELRKYRVAIARCQRVAAYSDINLLPLWYKDSPINWQFKVMETLRIIAQLIVGLGILNVWLVRFRTKTPYRAGDSSNMKEEFAAYGLPGTVMWMVCVIKVAAAVALLIGISVPQLVFPSATILAILMLVAIAMHIKVKDPATKSLPASVVLLLSLFLALSS